MIRELNGGDCKTYLVVSRKTREAALIDPLLERSAAYIALLKKEGLKLRFVADTHTHADHLSGCADLMKRLGAEYVMGEGALPACVRRRVGDGETLAFGEVRLTFVGTPGHTTDSMSIETEGAFLSGDFLFIGELGAGRLDLPGGDPSAHFDSLRRLDALKDDTRLLPGHDYRGKTESTLGAERRANPVLLPRKRDAYLKWWKSKQFAPADWMKIVVRANRSCTVDAKSVKIPKMEGACAAACAAQPPAQSAVPQISPKELARLIKDKKKAPFLLDVRGADEFDGELGHIAGSVLIPLPELSSRKREVPADRPVAVICRSGGRATKAALELQAAGIEKLRVLTGGMLAWREAGLK